MKLHSLILALLSLSCLAQTADKPASRLDELPQPWKELMQLVLLVPIANPYAFFTTDRFTNKQKIDLYDPQISYWDPPKLKLAVPQRTPELAAFLGIVDECQPEIHLDLHGTGLQVFPDDNLGDRTMRQVQTMFEVSACSYSNCGVRPWGPRVTEAMVKAGVEAGFGSDRAEAGAQRCFYNPDHDVFRSRLWNAPRPQRFRTMFYGHMKYHTMISTTEIGWEKGGVARVSGILALGNKQWVDENFSGYPVTRGYTQVQINLPPEKTKTMDLYVVTCAYNGNEKRSYGWKPPEAVMRQLKSENKP